MLDTGRSCSRSLKRNASEHQGSGGLVIPPPLSKHCHGIPPPGRRNGTGAWRELWRLLAAEHERELTQPLLSAPADPAALAVPRHPVPSSTSTPPAPQAASPPLAPISLLTPFPRLEEPGGVWQSPWHKVGAGGRCPMSWVRMLYRKGWGFEMLQHFPKPWSQPGCFCPQWDLPFVCGPESFLLQKGSRVSASYAASAHPCSFLLAAPFHQQSPECHQTGARDDQGRRSARLELIQGVL